MCSADTIIIGNNKESRFMAFGDDSKYQDTLVFAFIFILRSRKEAAEDRLRGLKRLFKIPVETSLHCRILRHVDARRKANLSHLSDDDFKSIVRRSIDIINKYKMQVRYTYTSLCGTKLSETESITLSSDHEKEEMTIRYSHDPKGMLGFLMQGCFCVSPDGSNGPTANQCEIITFNDKTKIPFLGNKRQRADGLYTGYSDIGASENSVFKICPQISNEHEHSLLELADIMAYTCSHALSTDEVNNSFFKQQLERVVYRVAHQFQTDPI